MVNHPLIGCVIHCEYYTLASILRFRFIAPLNIIKSFVIINVIFEMDNVQLVLTQTITNNFNRADASIFFREIPRKKRKKEKRKYLYCDDKFP